MVTNITSTNTDVYDYSEGSEEGFNVEVANWANPIAENGANVDTLGDLLDNLEVALADPDKAAVLATYGITQDYIDDRRAGLNDAAVYDHDEWNDLFAKLDTIGMQGTFGLASMARLRLLDFSVLAEGTNLEFYGESAAKQEYANTAIGLMNDLVFGADPDDEIFLTDEVVSLLHDSGITADDVSSPKLKAILQGEDPSTISFSSSELSDASAEVSDVVIEQADVDSINLLLELQAAQNRRLEAYALVSNTEKKIYDQNMAMANNIGSS